EIIRPILRGRDIKQFRYSFSNKWLINTHNGNKGKGIARINVERDYPAVFQHLCGYSSQLQQRLDKGDHWSNLRNCAYLDDFEKEKIIWIELTDRPNFALDINGYYLNNTIFFMTGEKLKYILGFLNTKLCEWYFDKIAATSGVGTRRWIKIYMDELPIPVVDQLDELHLTSLVNEVSNNENLTTARKKIYTFFYKLYNFEEEEISAIEDAVL
ncbi:TaqI-like C-terminal specificity domain-containing protein, partial [Parapedobacter indicus]